jgi:L-rhamnonate dehydratase
VTNPISRRRFLAAAPAAAAFAQTKPLKIAAVEIWKVRGHRETVRGVDQQDQVNPLNVYDELRPAPYRDAASLGHANAPVSTLYLKIVAMAASKRMADEQPRPFPIGKDALAQEKLWDRMYRSNRHSRRGFLQRAIGAADNTLWDFRGRYFHTPVYRLLGGPTRASVDDAKIESRHKMHWI